MIGRMTERVIAACDGASKGNPGPAGWAWVIADNEENPARWEAGPLGTATNNVAELTALERLLAAVDPAVALEIRMDSQYAMKAVTTWLPGWKRKGWKTAAGKPVANQDLVMRIDALLAGRSVEFRYVPAHQVDGDPLNDFADRAASRAAIVQEPAGSAQGSPPPPASDAVRPAGTRKDASGAAERNAAPRKRSAAKSTRTLNAKFPGRCRCGRSYGAGEPIAKNPDGWGHPTCRTATADGEARRQPHRTSAAVEDKVVRMRCEHRIGPLRLATRAGVAASTAHRILQRHGLPPLAATDRATGEPVRRYERARPGELVHIDVKKLGRIPDGGGHKVLGRAAGRKNRTAPEPPTSTPHSTTTPASPTPKTSPTRKPSPAQTSSPAPPPGSPPGASPSNAC